MVSVPDGCGISGVVGRVVLVSVPASPGHGGLRCLPMSGAIFALRWGRSRVNLKGVIESRWAGESSGVCYPWTQDHAHRRQDRAGTSPGEALLGPVEFGPGVVPALAMAGRPWGLEEPGGSGCFGRDGKTRLDPLAVLNAIECGPQGSRADGHRLGS